MISLKNYQIIRKYTIDSKEFLPEPARICSKQMTNRGKIKKDPHILWIYNLIWKPFALHADENVACKRFSFKQKWK